MRRTKHEREVAVVYARVVATARLVVEPLSAAAHQLRGMGQCKHCGDFDTNPQARCIEDAMEALRRALEHFDSVLDASPPPGESKEGGR